MKKYSYLFFLLWAMYFFGLQTVFATSDHLWINQVQIEGDGGNEDEFIELFNPTEQTISLDGWSIQYKGGNSNFPLSTSNRKNLPKVSIPSLGYFLIAYHSDSATSNYNGAVTADLGQATIKLSSTTAGATIFLVNSTAPLVSGTDSSVVDKLAYGNAEKNSPETTSATLPDSEKSLQRNGSDTDNNKADFTIMDSNPHAASASSTVAPTVAVPVVSEYTPPPVANPGYSTEIFISEILPNPDGPDEGEEWLELYNASTKEVDLTGWFIDDEGPVGIIGKEAYIFPNKTVIKANSYLAVDLSDATFGFNNTSSETVRIFWPNKSLLRQVTYEDGAKMDLSFARKSDGKYAWTELVTKGKPNKFAEEPVTPGVSLVTENKIRINEIFPDPLGTDSGAEWVEIINLGYESVNLQNWVIDDGEKTAEIGTSSYKIQNLSIKPDEVVLVSIPAGRFTLNNTNHETVRLFNPNKVLIDSVEYEEATENLSYQLLDGKWLWGTPSPDQINTLAEKIVAPAEPVKILTHDNDVPADATMAPSGILGAKIERSSLPRTGNASKALDMWNVFVLWAIICYIYGKLNPNTINP